VNLIPSVVFEYFPDADIDDARHVLRVRNLSTGVEGVRCEQHIPAPPGDALKRLWALLSPETDPARPQTRGSSRARIASDACDLGFFVGLKGSNP